MIVGVSYHASECECCAFSQMIVGVSYRAGECKYWAFLTWCWMCSSQWKLASTSVPHTLVTSTCGPIRPCGPNGTSDSIMTEKTHFLGIIDQLDKGGL